MADNSQNRLISFQLKWDLMINFRFNTNDKSGCNEDY